jgi:hypothetical protein
MTGGAPVQQRAVQRRAVQRLGNPVQLTDTDSGSGSPPDSGPVDSGPPADPDVDLATIKSEISAAASGPIGTFSEAEVGYYAAQIAPAGTLKRSTLDTEKANCTPKVTQAWKSGLGNDHDFCVGYASQDVIASRKFSELDGEADTNYQAGGAGPKQDFYSQLAGTLANGTVRRMPSTPRGSRRWRAIASSRPASTACRARCSCRTIRRTRSG